MVIMRPIPFKTALTATVVETMLLLLPSSDSPHDDMRKKTVIKMREHLEESMKFACKEDCCKQSVIASFLSSNVSMTDRRL